MGEMRRAAAVLELGSVRVGDGRPCLVVAEAGSAHQGDLARARELIDAAVEAGAGCVKFQVILADEIVHPRTGPVALPGGEVPLYERFRALERPEGFYAALKEHTERRGALFLASAFGVESARLLRRLGVAALKVASPEVNHFPLLEELSGYGLPVLLSTGVSTLGDIERALAVLGGAAAVLLHCITAYPAPEEQYNLRVLPLLRGIFGALVGVSDHSRDPLLVPGLAVLQGACVIEKHFALRREDGGLDDPIALEPEEFARMAAGIRRLEAAAPPEALAELRREYGEERVEAVLGDGVKRLAPAETRYYRTTNRSLHARFEIPVGAAIRPQDLCIVRSESNLRPGLDPAYVDVVTGKTARRRIPAGEGIVWEDLLGSGEGLAEPRPAHAGLPPARASRGPLPVDRADELLQLVDREGRPIGAASRGVCHGNPSLIQAVVHLYVFDRQGRLYLQRRAAGKDVFPGRWDTSVGGHLGVGESPDEALRREALEELELEAAGAEPLESYLFECDFESEYVFVYRLVTDQEPRPNREEIGEGRFFDLAQLQHLVREEPESFTPHFRQTFGRLA
ncbi:MAG: N-acetylneuraminate synthase family protein [Spirochaetales bacterium]|nr:N-acetylneuraminate synthase family protein [Spirochaetales bacterium]